MMDQASKDTMQARHDYIAQRNQKKSLLLRLPPELRNKIYAYAFDSVTIRRRFRPTDYPVTAALESMSGWLEMPVVEDGGALSLVCHQLRHETCTFHGTYRHLMWCDDLKFVRIFEAVGNRKARTLLSITSESAECFLRQQPYMCVISGMEKRLGLDTVYASHFVRLWIRQDLKSLHQGIAQKEDTQSAA
ncbi:hypothetical protein EKO04_008541 [Ascochyta lentis]|uniref:Uncharacterized protein n=1 Tax=Ascochyta lentis TaxID=205686 RepID=A0A8H7IZA0_9PLEO|nr:hypothetical protein EKO04_008541 [Ascochyta lentis]